MTAQLINGNGHLAFFGNATIKISKINVIIAVEYFKFLIIRFNLHKKKLSISLSIYGIVVSLKAFTITH
jgi:hypothetical protein